MNRKQRRRLAMANQSIGELYAQLGKTKRLKYGWRGSRTGRLFLKAEIAALKTEIARRQVVKAAQRRLMADLRRQASVTTAAGLEPLAAAATPCLGPTDKGDRGGKRGCTGG